MAVSMREHLSAWKEAWVEAEDHRELDDEGKQAVLDTLAGIHRAVAGHAEVEAVALANNTPYSSSTTGTDSYIDGVETMLLFSRVQPELMDVLRLELTAGRAATTVSQEPDGRGDLEHLSPHPRNA